MIPALYAAEYILVERFFTLQGSNFRVIGQNVLMANPIL